MDWSKACPETARTEKWKAGPAETSAASALTEREWIVAAYRVLQQGVELMPLEQLSQWQGIRAVIETCPVDDNAPN